MRWVFVTLAMRYGSVSWQGIYFRNKFIIVVGCVRAGGAGNKYDVYEQQDEIILDYLQMLA